MNLSQYFERKKRERELEKTVKVKKPRRKLSVVEKALFVLLGIILVAVILYFVYYYIHYVKYDKYMEYLLDYEYEEGSIYKPLFDDDVKVEGYELAVESEYLKLYTQVSTGNIAIYDKRNGEIVYSNPIDADEDSVANETNKGMLKSQFIAYYYNDDIVSGTFTSYDNCVLQGKLDIEGINNGIRYIYHVGDNNAGFVIPLEYRLYDDYLEVSIPEKGIEEIGNAYLYRIQVLRYMGATSYDDKGYMVVPNGSGSIINFNNGKLNSPSYAQYIYDIDPLASNYTTIEQVQSARLPIFAICKEESSLLVSIEDSAANCVISAGVSGVYNDYNYAYPSFVLRVTDNLKMFGDSTTDVFVMEPEPYDSNMCVRYSFLDSSNKGYSGVANYYRQRLVDEGVLSRNDSSEEMPFYYDIISGVKETGHFLGVQYLHSFAMTTFEDAGNISDELASMGINNQIVNLQGWFNGGYYHDAADNIHVMQMLGGQKGLSSLNERIRSNGGELFGDVAFIQVSYADKWFPYSKEASRYYGAGYVASFGLVNPTNLRNTSGLGYSENRYNILSPKFLPRYVAGFVSDINTVDIDGISLRDLGSVLASDKRRTCMITREQALDVVLGQFNELDNTGKSIMTNAANAYSFGYSDYIINAPLYATRYEIIDEEIPLYEMILHGCIDYSSPLLNFGNEDMINETRLHLIEFGAAPHYVFTMEESSRMKLTALNRYYATTYDAWKDNAVETYDVINDALKNVNDSFIINHEIIGNVRKVTYDNGIVIYVNYGNDEETVDGIVIAPSGYRVEEVVNEN